MWRIALFLLPAALQAQPLVTGFDRFHRGKSDIDGGRLLFNELGCNNCHSDIATDLPPRRGPALTGVTQRAKADWLRAYLTNPQKEIPGTTMPHLLQSKEVEPVLHYLGTVVPKSPAKAKSSKYLNSERGSDVFHTSGCVACHEPKADYQPPVGSPAKDGSTYASIALPEIAKKYSLSSLSSFLADPLKLRPGGRMPHTELHDSDVADLAAYLMDYHQSDGTGAPTVPAFKPDKALAAEGKKIVASHRCASCHDLPKDLASTPVVIAKPAGGCLSAQPGSGLPVYDLDKDQVKALQAYLAEQNHAGKSVKAELTLQALNCLACHERSGLGGPDAARKPYFTGDHSLGDTGLYPPPLTAVGSKLIPQWFEGVMEGKNRIRPYLQTKMPRYGIDAKALVWLLTDADHKDRPALQAGDLAAGKKLLGVAGGMGCITCHRWQKRPSLGIQALDISTMGQRLQPGWLREYLINPASYRAGTLMPSFWPNGVSANPTVLGGDTERQIASIYAFAQQLKEEPEGYPATFAGEFELVPKDRPIIQRTFLEHVGTHAILVGFPEGIHLAYDAQHCRPAILWKGKFFDAYNTWFTRAAPFENPLGTVVGKWPAPSTAEPETAFRGYKLDAGGTPTFLYDLGPVRVQETFRPVKGKLNRTVTWDNKKLETLTLDHPADVTVEEAKDSVAGNRIYIYSWK